MSILEPGRIRMLGYLTAADNEKMFVALQMMLKSNGKDQLIKTLFETAYVLLAKSTYLDRSNVEVTSYMETIVRELKNNDQGIILEARKFFDSVDAIDFVEECDKLLNHKQDKSSQDETS